MEGIIEQVSEAILTFLRMFSQPNTVLDAVFAFL